MLFFWRLFGISLSNCAKFVSSEPPSGLNQWLKFQRGIHLTMMDNLLQPPLQVKGMKILDKEQFKKSITVPCLYIPNNLIKECQKTLKNYLLKLQNFKPLSTPSTNFIDAVKENGVNASIDDGKMAVLDPRKIIKYSDIVEIDRNSLAKINITEHNLAFIDFILNYDNWKADEILRAVIPSEFDSVSGYSLVGHIVHLNLRDHLNDYKSIISNVLLDKIKCARTVVNKIDIIDSTFRNFQMELLCGDDEMITKVRENKCIFEFDFSQVYWNPRLSTEHERIVDSLKKGDIVYDVFCGVGPFSVPAAKKGCSVLANDLNPHSVKWLQNNIKLNKVIDRVTVFNKDGHEFIKEDIKNHMMSLKADECQSLTIIMNLPALAPSFLPSFQNLFSLEELNKLQLLPTPKVIVYCFFKGIGDACEGALNMIGHELGMKLTSDDEEVVDTFFVRDVAPNKKMMRVTLLLTKKVLSNRKRCSNELSNSEDSQSKKLCN